MTKAKGKGRLAIDTVPLPEKVVEGQISQVVTGTC